MSLVVQGDQKTFIEKSAAHSGPLGDVARGLEMTNT
jgi:hypothetical protein